MSGQPLTYKYPVWTIANAAAYRTHGLPGGVQFLEDAEVGEFFPVFTEELIAEQAAASTGLPGLIAAQIDSREELRGYLVAYQKTGGHHVGLDIGDVGRIDGWIFDLGAFIASLGQ
jgi:hypothetical protein